MPTTSTPPPSASLTADPERFSAPAWDLLVASQDMARRWRHGAMDVEHLLLTLFTDPRFAAWATPLPVDENRLLDRLEAFCAAQPTASDPTLYIGDALEDLLEEADRRRQVWATPLLELPHLLLALLEEPRIGARLLLEEGLSEDLLLRQWRPAAAPASGPGADGWVDAEPAARTLTPPVAPPVAAPAADPAAGRAAAGRPGRAEGSRPPQSRLEATSPDDGLRLEALDGEAALTALDRYGRDLTAAARAGELDPVIGRDSEIRRLIQVLSRRGKNNPVLVGESGVGKTAVVESLAQRIVAGDVPDALRGLRLVALDLGALIAGAKFRGQFEERLREVLAQVREGEATAGDAGGGVVLFID
jgi:ATP-dependent Clp protease ATP-binding subunit ClpA